MAPFEGFDLTGFWKEPNGYARKNYIEPPKKTMSCPAEGQSQMAIPISG